MLLSVQVYAVNKAQTDPDTVYYREMACLLYYWVQFSIERNDVQVSRMHSVKVI